MALDFVYIASLICQKTLKSTLIFLNIFSNTDAPDGFWVKLDSMCTSSILAQREPVEVDGTEALSSLIRDLAPPKTSDNWGMKVTR